MWILKGFNMNLSDCEFVYKVYYNKEGKKVAASAWYQPIQKENLWQKRKKNYRKNVNGVVLR